MATSGPCGKIGRVEKTGGREVWLNGGREGGRERGVRKKESEGGRGIELGRNEGRERGQEGERERDPN